MYTGIITGQGVVVELERKPGFIHFGVEFPADHLLHLIQGASVSLDGVCLTVVEQKGQKVYFDAMQETLAKTTLGALKLGNQLNLERSALSGTEIGGHVVSGHVDGIATITAIERPENNLVMTFQADPGLTTYIFSKGFIALNGASLTVVDAQPETCSFKIWFIPETLRKSTFGSKQVGDTVNVEVEFQTKVLVETVERLLPQLVNASK